MLETLNSRIYFCNVCSHTFDRPMEKRDEKSKDSPKDSDSKGNERR